MRYTFVRNAVRREFPSQRNLLADFGLSNAETYREPFHNGPPSRIAAGATRAHGGKGADLKGGLRRRGTIPRGGAVARRKFRQPGGTVVRVVFRKCQRVKSCGKANRGCGGDFISSRLD